MVDPCCQIHAFLQELLLSKAHSPLRYNNESIRQSISVGFRKATKNRYLVGGALVGETK